MKTLLQSLPMLFDVLVLVGFAFFIFGIVGVQLFSEKLRNKCGGAPKPSLGVRGVRGQPHGGVRELRRNVRLAGAPEWRFDQTTDDLCSGVMYTTYPGHGTGGPV